VKAAENGLEFLCTRIGGGEVCGTSSRRGGGGGVKRTRTTGVPNLDQGKKKTGGGGVRGGSHAVRKKRGNAEVLDPEVKPVGKKKGE